MRSRSVGIKTIEYEKDNYLFIRNLHLDDVCVLREEAASAG